MSSQSERELIEELNSTVGQYEPLVRQFLELVASGRHSEVATLVGRIVPLVDAFDRTGQKLSAEQRRLLTLSREEASAMGRRATVLLSILLAGLLGATMFAGMVTRGAMRPVEIAVHDLSQGARQVAANAEETASAGEEPSSPANHINETVAQLSAMVHGR